jgi:uracil-DNA glycosylase
MQVPVRLLMLTDGYPQDEAMHYVHAHPDSLAWQNTRQLLEGIGVKVDCYDDIRPQGILLTTCLESVVPEKVTSGHIEIASEGVERIVRELPDLRAIGLMGDTAIAAFNRMCRRQRGDRLIPAGATYRIRNQDFFWNEVQVFPSYLHTGRSYLIERSKQRMVAEDMARMARYLH